VKHSRIRGTRAVHGVPLLGDFRFPSSYLETSCMGWVYSSTEFGCTLEWFTITVSSSKHTGMVTSDRTIIDIPGHKSPAPQVHARAIHVCCAVYVEQLRSRGAHINLTRTRQLGKKSMKLPKQPASKPNESYALGTCRMIAFLGMLWPGSCDQSPWAGASPLGVDLQCH
jgi:hypothetical protein